MLCVYAKKQAVCKPVDQKAVYLKKKTMELARENKLEAIADLNRAFAEKLNIEDIPAEEPRENILKMIQQTDEHCFSVLAAFNNAWLAYDYVRGDKELRHKVEDVWKMEVDRHREALDDCMDRMYTLAEEMDVNLEPLKLRLKWL